MIPIQKLHVVGATLAVARGGIGKPGKGNRKGCPYDM